METVSFFGRKSANRKLFFLKKEQILNDDLFYSKLYPEVL